MEKYVNISDYCKENNLTVEDFKDMMLSSALSLGCAAEQNFSENVKETAQVFTTLYFFNDILNKVQ